MGVGWNPNSEFLREPNLLIPGKAPVGSVKIDWSHPLSAKLVAAVIITNRGAEDLVSRIAAQNGANITQGVSPSGNRHLTGDGTQTSAGSVSFVDGENGLQGSGPHSVVAKLYMPADIVHNRYILGQRGPSYIGTWFFKHLATSKINIAHYASNWVYNFISTGWPYDTWNTVGYSTDGASGTDLNVYRDGGYYQTGTTLLVTDLSNTANDLHFIGETVDDKNANPSVEYLYLYQRELSDAEHESIANDPYQFLIPA